MQVKALKKGFAGTAIRKEGDTFEFSGFEFREDGTDNLGSWMKPTEKGQKELDSLNKKHKAKVAAEAKAKADKSET